MDKTYQKGGALRKNSYFISRSEYLKLMLLIEKGEYVTITAPRATGKTSLIKKAILKLKSEGFLAGIIDLRKLSTIPREVKEKEKWFYKWLEEQINYTLKVPESIYNNWKAKISNRQYKSYYQILESYLIECIKEFAKDKKVVLFFDETENLKIFGSFTNSFIELINDMYAGEKNPNLQIVCAGIYPTYMLIGNSKISNFKAHIPSIALQDFKIESAQDWSIGINNKINLSARILEWTNGHPYLTSLLHGLLVDSKTFTLDKLDNIVRSIIFDAKKHESKYPHFKAPFDFLKETKTYAYKALNIYTRIIRDEEIKTTKSDDRSVSLLRSSGIVNQSTDESLKVRNNIYREVFDFDWIKESEQMLGSSAREVLRNRYVSLDKPKICLINYGGTIGMIEKDGEVVPPLDESEFFEVYPEIHHYADIDYKQLEPPKDGANIFPSDWSIIAKFISNKRVEDYSGYIVAMGTDTLQYAASAVAFALGSGLNKPVVFVGAQATHRAFYGDAQVNLYRAIRVASKKIPEVVVVFSDKVFRAVRVQKVSDFSLEGFASPTLSPLATIGETIEINQPLLINEKIGRINLINDFEDRILQISHHPGMQVKYYLDILNNNPDLKAILIETLGIGNISNMGESYDFLPLIKKAIEDYNIPVVIASRYPINPEFINKYIPAMEPIKYGAIHALNMSSSAALTKLMWLLPQIDKSISSGDLKSQDKIDELKELMEFSYVGEVDKKTKTN